MNTISLKGLNEAFPSHEQWLERLLDRATSLMGSERFWFGVWIKRFRRFCYAQPDLKGLDVVPLAKAYLAHLESWPDSADWQVGQAREALRLFIEKQNTGPRRKIEWTFDFAQRRHAVIFLPMNLGAEACLLLKAIRIPLPSASRLCEVQRGGHRSRGPVMLEQTSEMFRDSLGR